MTNQEQAVYWDRQPCNIRHPDWKYIVEPHILEFAQFERWKGRRVLEVGCGIGTDTMSFARAEAKVTAVDISSKSLHVCDVRLRRAGLRGNALLYLADIEDGLPFNVLDPSGWFELIYAFGVLHHTANPNLMLSSMRRFSHGTLLKLMVYHRYSYKNLRIKLFGERTEAQAGCPMARTYSRRQIRKLVEDHGFRVTSVRARHLFPYRIKDYAEGRLIKTALFRWMPKWIYWGLERVVGWHLLVEAVAI